MPPKILLLVASILLATAGHAQSGSTTPEDDEAICIGSPRWNPNSTEVQDIEREPIPASFRQVLLERCAELPFLGMALIDWHLRFGTEQSVRPALNELRQRHLVSRPAPPSYLSELRGAWRAAQGDLRRAGAITQPPGLNYSVRGRFTAASRPIQRLEALIETRERYLYLARQYLSAAEEFGSLTLLDTAEGLLAPAVAGATFLAPLENQPPVAGILHFNLQTFRADDLEMRAAVLRARLIRTPEAMAQAEIVVQAKARPHYYRLGELAFSGGEDFCDISDGAGDRESVEAACAADEDALQERVVSYFLARAMLDLVVRPAAVRDSDNPATAMRLLNMERLPDRGRCCYYRSADDLRRLRLAIAESRRRLLTGAAPMPDGYSSTYAWSEALDDLREAERLSRPFEAPARFRRIAEAWLTLWRQGETLFSREDYDPPFSIESPERNRYATYLRRTLASLDAIAAGTDTGLPASRN